MNGKKLKKALDKLRFWIYDHTCGKHPGIFAFLQRIYRLFTFVRYGRKSPARMDQVHHTRELPAAFHAVVPFVLPYWDKPTVTIVIPAYNNFPYTYACIKSIEANTKIPYEIILADDASTDDTARAEQIISGLRVLHQQKNLHFIRNFNAAAKLTCGKYLVLMNNDVCVKENWLPPLLDILESNPQAGYVGPKILFGDGKLQEAGSIIWSDGHTEMYGCGEDPLLPAYNYVKECDYISACCTVMRFSLWEQLGGFDTHFIPAYYEDADLCMGVRSLGYTVQYQPASEVVHYHGVSGFSSESMTNPHRLVAEHQPIFKEKWADTLSKEHQVHGKNVFYARDRSASKSAVLFLGGQGCLAEIVASPFLAQFGRESHAAFFITQESVHKEITRQLRQCGVEVLLCSDNGGQFNKWICENGRYLDVVYFIDTSALPYLPLLRKKSSAYRTALFSPHEKSSTGYFDRIAPMETVLSVIESHQHSS